MFCFCFVVVKRPDQVTGEYEYDGNTSCYTMYSIDAEYRAVKKKLISVTSRFLSLTPVFRLHDE